MYDLAILNGNVNIGDLSKSKICNIGIRDSKISYIGNDKITATKIIDANGYEVTPGFIDLHTHSDLSFIIDPDADSKLVQGVTFELMGNCGMSFCSPLSKDNKYQLQERLNRYGVSKNMDWNNFDDWLNEIQNNTPSINVAAQIGHGNLRSFVMGMEARHPTPYELDKMKEDLDNVKGELGEIKGLLSTLVQKLNN